MVELKEFKGYFILEDGRLWSEKLQRYKVATLNKVNGYFYYSFSITKKTHKRNVHRLVAEHYIVTDNLTLQVNHIDGNKRNNHVSNLEWVTHKVNAIHAVSTGLRIYNNTMTKELFYSVYDRIISGVSYTSLLKDVPLKLSQLSVKMKQYALEVGLYEELEEALRVNKRKTNGTELVHHLDLRGV